jgi:uncharacterized delta-60 repeat protein
MFFSSWLRNRNSNPRARRATAARPKHTRFRPLLEVLEDRCVPTAGFLDPTFGTTGVVTTQVSPYVSEYAGVAIYAPGTANAGKIVTVGQGSVTTGKNSFNTFALVRYNQNGSLDSTFGTGGIVQNTLGGSADGTAVALVGDKIVAGGTFEKVEHGAITTAFALARFNADGSLDQTFGSGGTVITSFSPSGDHALEIAVQADGKIVLAGYTYLPVGKKVNHFDFAVARYTPNGALDATFGNGGKVTIDVGESLESFYPGQRNMDMALSGDRIDLAGIGGTSENLYVAQLTATGQLDPSFGVGGVVKGGQCNDLALAAQSDGKVVVAFKDITVAGKHVTRLLANGSPDTTFGTGGTVAVPDPGGVPFAMKVDPLGRFVIGGWQLGTTFMVLRLTSAGALDSSFGVGGIGTSGNLVSLDDTYGGFGMALQPDGKPVLVSTTRDYKSAVARFDGDPAPQIGSFTASPNPVTAGSSVTLTASNLTDTNPGATITQVAFSYIDNSGNQHLLGDAAQTSPGVWTLSFSPSTSGLTSGTYTLLAQAEDSYGVFGDPFAITETVN